MSAWKKMKKKQEVGSSCIKMPECVKTVRGRAYNCA